MVIQYGPHLLACPCCMVPTNRVADRDGTVEAESMTTSWEVDNRTLPVSSLVPLIWSVGG